MGLSALFGVNFGIDGPRLSSSVPRCMWSALF